MTNRDKANQLITEIASLANRLTYASEENALAPVTADHLARLHAVRHDLHVITSALKA